MNTYIVFDERAKYDVDEASIIEYMGEYEDEEEALTEAMQSWEGYDHVLIGYKSDEPELSTVVSKYSLLHGTRL